MNVQPFIWLGLLVIFALAEGMTAGLVSIWFALGAVAALITSLLTTNVLVQIIVFAVVSVVCMALIRPLASRYFTPRHEATNADRIIGEKAMVIQPIDPINGTGQVKVGGKIWTACSDSSEPIPAETLVTVLAIEGVKVRVAPVPAPASHIR